MAECDRPMRHFNPRYRKSRRRAEIEIAQANKHRNKRQSIEAELELVKLEADAFHNETADTVLSFTRLEWEAIPAVYKQGAKGAIYRLSWEEYRQQIDKENEMFYDWLYPELFLYDPLSEEF